MHETVFPAMHVSAARKLEALLKKLKEAAAKGKLNDVPELIKLWAEQMEELGLP
jgi:hypothetical protein